MRPCSSPDEIQELNQQWRIDLSAPDKDELLPSEEVTKLGAEIAKLAKLPCPRCGKNAWSTLPGYTQVLVAKEPKVRNSQAPFLPVVTRVCSTCGFLSQHALQIVEPDRSSDE